MMYFTRGYCRKITAILTVIIVWGFLNIASAIQVGKTVEYKGGGMGKVIFDGKNHNEAGLHCLKCHNQYFITKIGSAKIKYTHHVDRKEYCFVCHNGSLAFDAVENCHLCHKR